MLSVVLVACLFGLSVAQQHPHGGHGGSLSEDLSFKVFDIQGKKVLVAKNGHDCYQYEPPADVTSVDELHVAELELLTLISNNAGSQTTPPPDQHGNHHHGHQAPAVNQHVPHEVHNFCGHSNLITLN